MTMELLLLIESKNYAKLKELLLTDDTVSRSSISFKEGSIFGKDNYYCYVSGTENQCKRVLELIIDNDVELAKEIVGKEKEEIINKIKEEENKAVEGFGNIFG